MAVKAWWLSKPINLFQCSYLGRIGLGHDEAGTHTVEELVPVVPYHRPADLNGSEFSRYPN